MRIEGAYDQDLHVNYSFASALKKTDPVMLKIMDPQAAQLSGNFLVIVGLVDPVGEKSESVVNLWVGNCLQLSIRLSTCPEGLGLVRRTRP